MAQVQTVLSRLEKAGFRANVRKCFFAKSEIDYLGYWLTRKGIQPQPKKVEAVLRLKPPKNRKQLRHFLGMVNFYRDMWRRRSHLLAPLTGLVSEKTPWKWGEEQEKAFEEMKRIMSKETLLAFPDFNKEFHVYTDASNYQLGAVIMQEDKPLAFYSRKMNKAQQRYTMGDQELLSIVETLKEFRNILLGQKLVVHTDHKNIVYGNLSNDRIVRWRLLLEEFGPEYIHIKGKDNVVADALSRMEADFENKQSIATEAKTQATAKAMCMLKRKAIMSYSEGSEEPLMAHLLAIAKDQKLEKFLMNPRTTKREQQVDK
jgi:hypothetical protein